jgi:hypothetical protein
MIYADYNGLQTIRMRSSRNTPSATKNHQMSDSLSGHRHHHHHYQKTGGKNNNLDVQQQQQQQENESNEESNGRKRAKSQEQIIQTNTQMGT